jgi:predicted alpha/beta-hydrolase family hydrolase
MQAECWRVTVGEEGTSALFEPATDVSGDVLVLAHGAGGNMEHRHMGALAAEFARRGLHVVRFNFLYRELGQGPPDRMPRLMECYAAVVRRVREEVRPRRLFIGGHSMGGRTATMLAAEGFECDGLVLLAYPLHPPGKPEKLRSEHLPRIRQPVLAFSGTRDEFCDRELMERVLALGPARWTQHWIEDADHGFRLPKRAGTYEAVLERIGATTREWLLAAIPTDA